MRFVLYLLAKDLTNSKARKQKKGSGFEPTAFELIVSLLLLGSLAQSVVNRPKHDLSAAGQSQLGQDITDMGLDCALA